MSLSDKQWTFLQDVASLVYHIATEYPHMKVTAGEMYRTHYQQNKYVEDGLSQVEHSKHQDRLAIDLNFFFNGQYLAELPKKEQKLMLQAVGNYWESLEPGNQWGGNWDFFDPAHFQA